MIKGIFLAGRSMDSKFKSIEVISNNLANVNTNGYKKAMPFTEVINQYNNAEIKQMTNFKQGSYTATGNPLDLSVDGNAFFTVQGEDSMDFTRGGKFSISDNGFLINDQGYKVLGSNGPINLNGYLLDKNQSIKISKHGEITVGDNYVDKLLMVKPEPSDRFMRKDGTNFSSPDGRYFIADESEFQVNQGYLEQSNVNPIEEMTNMMKLHNEYDSASKMVTFLNQSLSEANEIGKV
ncbi:MAG: flagellar hook-basal body complex protein [Ignavibacteriaceae bacterium]